MKKKYAKPVLLCYEVMVKGAITLSAGIKGDKSGDNTANSPMFGPNW